MNMSGMLDRIQNFSKTVTSILISLLALGGSGFVFKSIILPQAVVVEQIYMPSILEERGYKSEIVVQRVLDEIQSFKTVAKIDRVESAVFGSLASKPDVNVDATVGGVSLKSIEQMVGSVFGKRPKTISGEIINVPGVEKGVLQARLRIDNKVISTRSVPVGKDDLDTLIRQISFDLYREFEPVRAALAAARLGQTENAREALRSILISGDPDDRKYALWLRSTLGNQRQRELDLLESISIDPKFTLSLVSLSALDRDRKNFEASSNYADRAISSNPQSPMGYHEKGRTLRAERRMDEATKQFTQACSLPLEYAPCHNQLGEMMLQTADDNANNVESLRKAYYEFVKAMKIDARHAWSYSNAAYAAMRVGDLYDAQILIGRAQELDSKSPAHRIRYAGIMYRLGNKDQARSIVLAMLPSIPNWEEAPPDGWGNRSLIREVLK